MSLDVTLLGIRWEGVSGAEKYEIKVDGKVVATAGSRARTTRVSVPLTPTKIEITDLPNRTLAQTLDFSQEDL